MSAWDDPATHIRGLEAEAPVACLAFDCTRPVRPPRKFCGRCQTAPDFTVRLWPQIEKTSTCWLWKGLTGPLGYGSVAVQKTAIRVHRLVFELVRGKIPEGAVLDHLCRVRNCVNPDHLEPVDGATNTLRGIGFAAINARKTHCINGHEYTPENTYWRPNRQGRDCKTCISDRGRKRDQRTRRSKAATHATAYEMTLPGEMEDEG